MVMKKRTNVLSDQLINANDLLLTTEDVAEMLSIKPSSVRKRVSRGTIPSYKPAGSRRRMFSHVDIMNYIKSNNSN